MATTTRRLLTSFSKGELSPLMEGRPDLAAFFEGGSTLLNVRLLRQGGVTRRPGLRVITEAKDHTKDVILLPFEASIDDAFVVEFGNGYVRFIKDKAQIVSGGVPVELVSPYLEEFLRTIHYTQSVDVMFLFHEAVRQQRLSRISDTVWSLLPIQPRPSPSFETDADVSEGTITVALAITTGTDVIVTASAPVFLRGDVGRQIIYGSSRAIITDFGASAGDTASPNDNVRVDIIDDFPNVDPIDAGLWFLRGSPQATLNPSAKQPVGAQVTLVAGVPTFRAADVGKFITIYGGLVEITRFDSATQVRGTILSVMEGTSDVDPAAAPAGAWQLEVASWSDENGFPRTGEFYQGRLGVAGTFAQPTTFWMSASDNFDDYAVGTTAERAIDYTIASRALNRIEWLTDNVDLFIGTAGAELRVRSGREEEPLGGDSIPLVTKTTVHGSAPIQPVVISRRIIFVERMLRQILVKGFSIEEDGYDVLELTGAAEHITNSKIRFGPIAFQRRPDPILHFVRNDGELIALTYNHHEKVIGFTRYATEGTFESVCVIPKPGGNDQVYVVVKRMVQGEVKRFIEMFEDDAEEMEARPWRSLQTDCARVYDLASVPTTVLDGLDHIKGKMVDVVTDGSFRGQFIVADDGTVTLLEPAIWHAEVGLHYDSEVTTMRPSIQEAMVEGLPRSWRTIWARVFETIGTDINDEAVLYVPAPTRVTEPPLPTPPSNVPPLYSGDVRVSGYGIDTDGRITIRQEQPYPMTILAIFGEIQFGDHG